MATRNETITRLMQMADRLTQDYSWDLYRDMFSACIDRNHPTGPDDGRAYTQEVTQWKRSK